MQNRDFVFKFSVIDIQMVIVERVIVSLNLTKPSCLFMIINSIEGLKMK